jgi:hypothetical protein
MRLLGIPVGPSARTSRIRRHAPKFALLAALLSPSLALAAQLTLTWTDNANNERGYQVERQIGGGGYSQIATLGANATSYTDSNLAEATTHCYRVRAFNAAGVSGYSNEACKVTTQTSLNLTVAKSGNGTGTVSSVPVGIICGSDCTETFPSITLVTLTAAAASGSRFDGWSGGGCSGTAPCTIIGNTSPTVTAAFSSTATGGTCTTGQYQAEYFNNINLTGTATLRRCETAIAYNWGGGGPGNGLPNNNFSARWTGRFNFATTGSYQFTARVDDGVRVWVDGSSIIRAWKNQSATTYKATVTLSAGTHEVKVEYYERGGVAVAQVSWTAASGTGSAEVPITSAGTAMAKGTAPIGSGAGLSVIRDGDKPPVGSADSRRQYDSYDGANAASDDWVGYQFASLQTLPGWYSRRARTSGTADGSRMSDGGRRRRRPDGPPVSWEARTSGALFRTRSTC